MLCGCLELSRDWTTLENRRGSATKRRLAGLAGSGCPEGPGCHGACSGKARRRASLHLRLKALAPGRHPQQPVFRVYACSSGGRWPLELASLVNEHAPCVFARWSSAGRAPHNNALHLTGAGGMLDAARR